MEAEMKKLFKGIFLLAIMCCFAVGCFAWDDELAGTTEITGYYQQYRDYFFDSGTPLYRFGPTRLGGGGFSIAYNLAEWFAIWTQVSIYGTVNQLVDFGGLQVENRVRIVNNLQGLRWQTKQYGPFRLYGKAGAGIAWHGFSLYDSSYNANMDMSGSTFSVGYGGGLNVWLTRNIGITLDASQTTMALPNLTGISDRKKWDGGTTYMSGLTFRF